MTNATQISTLALEVKAAATSAKLKIAEAAPNSPALSELADSLIKLANGLSELATIVSELKA